MTCLVSQLQTWLTLHPPSVSLCQEPPEICWKGFAWETWQWVLIPNLSGKSSWKQLSCTHLQLSVSPLLCPAGQQHYHTGTACTGSRRFLAVGAHGTGNKNTHFSPCTIASSLCSPGQLSPQSFSALGLHRSNFTYTNFLNPITNYFKHEAFLASPWINVSSSASSQKIKTNK